MWPLTGLPSPPVSSCLSLRLFAMLSISRFLSHPKLFISVNIAVSVMLCEIVGAKKIWFFLPVVVLVAKLIDWLADEVMTMAEEQAAEGMAEEDRQQYGEQNSRTREIAKVPVFNRRVEEDDTIFAFEEAGFQTCIAVLDEQREAMHKHLLTSAGEEKKLLEVRLEKIATAKQEKVDELVDMRLKRRINQTYRVNQLREKIQMEELAKQVRQFEKDKQRIEKEDRDLAFKEATIEAEIVSMDQRQSHLLKQPATGKSGKKQKPANLPQRGKNRETLIAELQEVRTKRLAIRMFREKEKKERIERERGELNVPVLAITANTLMPDRGIVVPIDESAGKQVAEADTSCDDDFVLI